MPPFIDRYILMIKSIENNAITNLTVDKFFLS